jgi:hypothetical protein
MHENFCFATMSNSPYFFYRWIKLCLFNFLLVAVAGVILRYKITFSLPFLDQKNFLHAHSHFAFAGWLSQIIMVFIVQFLAENSLHINIKLYNKLLCANAITAYGMLATFPFQGYGLYSIIFSTLSVFASYFFIAIAWKDFNTLHKKQHITRWFKAGLFFLGLSSLGAFSLAYFMANHINGAAYYFGAVYFFLHFQYNGWFLFACFGLLFYQLEKNGFTRVTAFSKPLFNILFFTCIPCYLLSVLWMDLSPVIRIIAAITAMIQLLGIIYILKLFVESKEIFSLKLDDVNKIFWFMAMMAFIIKLILQSFSVVPSLSAYAFGFRPVVIGYLHLCFLGIFTFFILGNIFEYFHSIQKSIASRGAYIFVSGVILTESVLMLQGVFAITSNALVHADIILFAAAIVMLIGISSVFFSIRLPK